MVETWDAANRYINENMRNERIMSEPTVTLKNLYSVHKKFPLDFSEKKEKILLNFECFIKWA